MSILETVIAYKKTIVQASKEAISINSLEKSSYFNTPVNSLKKYLNQEDRVGIIAEIKRASPSTGIIKNNVDVGKLANDYIQSGASALSVLTDVKFFGGSNEDIQVARKSTQAPILRKDFTIDEYQILEAKSLGADCILLIAACLTPKECRSLSIFAKNLGLEVLLEVHNKDEIDSHVNEYLDLIGVNNRNLKDFTTNINQSKLLFEYLPKELVKISESGIAKAHQIKELKDVGYNGFLIGGFFMKHDDPSLACKSLIDNYKIIIK